jgi:hypothetical protein
VFELFSDPEAVADRVFALAGGVMPGTATEELAISR